MLCQLSYLCVMLWTFGRSVSGMALWIFAHRIPNSFLWISRFTVIQDNDLLPSGYPCDWTQPTRRRIVLPQPKLYNFPCCRLRLNLVVLHKICCPCSVSVALRAWAQHDSCLLTQTLPKESLPAVTSTKDLSPLPGLFKDSKLPAENQSSPPELFSGGRA